MTTRSHYEMSITFIKAVRDLSLEKFSEAQTDEARIDALLEGYDDLLAYLMVHDPDWKPDARS